MNVSLGIFPVLFFSSCKFQLRPYHTVDHVIICIELCPFYLLFIVRLGGGGKGFEGREKEEICIRKHEHATGQASKQEAEEQRPHRACGTPLYSKCYFATSSFYGKICFAWSLLSWILYMAPLSDNLEVSIWDCSSWVENITSGFARTVDWSQFVINQRSFCDWPQTYRYI